MPDQRKLWQIRKLYGNIPPTDPRFLALTREQIELDLIHNYLDHQTDGKENVYLDEDFEDFDKQSDEYDSKTTDYYDMSQPYNKPQQPIPPSVKDFTEEEWEEVKDE